MNRHDPMLPEDDVRETPPELYLPLHARFGFTLDACATHQNAKCDHYFTEGGEWVNRVNVSMQVDGLTGDWNGHRVWCNPPYSDIAAWVLKAWESEAELVYMLLPSTRTDQEWWQELVEPYRDGRCPTCREMGGLVAWRCPHEKPPMHLITEFLQGRQKFLEDGRPVPARDRAGNILKNKNGTEKKSSPKFGCVGLIWLPQ